MNRCRLVEGISAVVGAFAVLFFLFYLFCPAGGPLP